jgi:catechol 2,3-dioxygenase-like lactoylglutathione lyase family enzyme
VGGARHTFAVAFVRAIGVSNHNVKGRATVPVQVTTIMLGVEDLARSKQFYGQGLGCEIRQDYPSFVLFDLGEGTSSLALYEREAAAQDAGVSSEGSGFRGVSFHYIVGSKEEVDDVMAQAVKAGAGVVKEVEATQWGCFGYFSDPDGYLWKVATGG